MRSMIPGPGGTADPSTSPSTRCTRSGSGRDDKQKGVGMTTKNGFTDGFTDKERGRPAYPRVGMDVSTPVRMPVGHRDVTVLRRVLKRTPSGP